MPEESPKQKLKLVIVGDPKVGKSSLLMSLKFDKFPEGSIDAVCDNILIEGESGNEFFQFNFWDTNGSDEYNKLRPLSYPHSDLIIICFSVDSRQSFNNVKYKWIPEVKINFLKPKILISLI